MTGTILDKIIDSKLLRIQESKCSVNVDVLKARVDARTNGQGGRFRNVLADDSRLNVIAEFKRASPSKGVISVERDPAENALAYERGGAAAISVLTEEDHFNGSLKDLIDIRSAVNIPILRKDFVVDEYQIYESAAAGADAILLIAAALSQDELLAFHSLAKATALDVIVEVHDIDELERAKDVGADLIGVNNRNLKTFEVNIDVSRELIQHKPEHALMIAESGLQTVDELMELNSLGFSGFLIGETLMRSGDPERKLREISRHVQR